MAANVDRIITSATGAIMLLAILFVFLVGIATAKGVDPMKLDELPFLREICGALLMALSGVIKRGEQPPPIPPEGGAR